MRGRARLRKAPGSRSRSSRATVLRLPFRNAHHEAVEFVRHLDLAGEARVRPHVVASVARIGAQRKCGAGLACGKTPALAPARAGLRSYACRSGMRTTRPSSSSVTLIWQERREFGRT